MKILVRKMYISIIACLLLLCATITTTYAWIGMLPFSSIGKYDMAINSESGDSIRISLDGINFYDYLDSNDIKKAILKKRKEYIKENGLVDDISDMYESFVETEFSKIAFKNGSTTDLIINNGSTTLTPFTDLNGNKSLEFFSFDLYITTDYDNEVNVNHNVEVFFSHKDIIKGKDVTGCLINSFTYPGEENNYIVGLSNKRITNYKTNTSWATRLAITKYDSVSKVNNKEEFDNLVFDNPTTKIYSPGEYKAYKVNESSDDLMYDFGGILPDDYNVAVFDYNTKGLWKGSFNELSVPDDLTRLREGYNDIYLDCNKIISLEDNLNINSMVKVEVYFWIEGWDADCFDFLFNQKISIGLGLTLKDPKLN